MWGRPPGNYSPVGVLEMEQKAGSDNVLYPLCHPFYMMPPRVSLDHTYIKSRPLLITTPNIYLTTTQSQKPLRPLAAQGMTARGDAR